MLVKCQKQATKNEIPVKKKKKNDLQEPRRTIARSSLTKEHICTYSSVILKNIWMFLKLLQLHI